MRAAVVGRLVQLETMPGVGRVRVGHDVDWNEYRVQAWDHVGQLVAEYHTDDRADALSSAGRMLERLAA